MNRYIEKNGKTVEICEGEENAYRAADAWQEMYPDADIRIVVEDDSVR